MLKRLKYCLLLITFASIGAQAPDDVTSSIKDAEFVDETLCADTDLVQTQTSNYKNEFKELSKEFLIDVAQIWLLEFLISSIATITHESGHAVAAKALLDVPNPIQIYIGTTTPETMPQRRLFSLDNMHFYNIFPWKRGITRVGRKRSIKQNHDAYENIELSIASATELSIAYVAGGLSTAAFMYTLLSTITGYCSYCDNKGLFEITLKSFINGASPFTYILNTKALSLKQKRFLLNATLVISLSLIDQFFYGCTPYRSGDGMKIWKEFMDVSGAPLKIAHGLSILGRWGCWALLIKKYCDARKKLFPEGSKMSIPVALIASLRM